VDVSGLDADFWMGARARPGPGDRPAGPGC
jgi:hypothetical protein